MAESIPPVTAVPMAFIAPAPAPVAMASGRTPKKNAIEVIMTGRNLTRTAPRVASISPSPWAIRSFANWIIRMAFFVVRPEGGEKTDLEVNIIVQAPGPGGQRCTEYTNGQHQQVGDRNRPAFIQGCYTQKDYYDGKGIQEGRLGA